MLALRRWPFGRSIEFFYLGAGLTFWSHRKYFLKVPHYFWLISVLLIGWQRAGGGRVCSPLIFADIICEQPLIYFSLAILFTIASCEPCEPYLSWSHLNMHLTSPKEPQNIWTPGKRWNTQMLAWWDLDFNHSAEEVLTTQSELLILCSTMFAAHFVLISFWCTFLLLFFCCMICPAHFCLHMFVNHKVGSTFLKRL